MSPIRMPECIAALYHKKSPRALGRGNRSRRRSTGSMDFQLDPAEARVLGSLLEKEVATPEYYPLSLNALVNACNQKSNREPVVSFDEDTVEVALEGLR